MLRQQLLLEMVSALFSRMYIGKLFDIAEQSTILD